jgi:hypothetical protein
MQHGASNYGFNIITKSKTIKNNTKYESGGSVKYHGKQYTDDAEILQSILKFSKKHGKEYWNSEKIREYLLENCNYYKKSYKDFDNRTKDSYILDIMIPQVSDLLEKLIYLELIESAFKIATDDSSEELYSFTPLGRLLGLVLDFRDNKVADDIYDHLLNFYDAMDNSFAKLCSIFIRTCRNSPLLIEMIGLIDDLLENATEDKDLFIHQIKCLTPILSKESWEILYDSFSELDNKSSKKYDILFYNFKLYIEELHGIKSQHLKEFERLRYYVMEDNYAITIEGYCHRCKNYTSYNVGLMEYLRSYAHANPTNRNHMDIECKICKRYLDFEFVNKIKTIKEPDKKIKKREQLRLGHINNKVDILETIFEKTQKGKYIIRSKCYQAILIFLSDNPDRFYKQREIENELIEKRTDLFDSDSELMPSKKADNQNEQFSLYFRVLSFFDLVKIVMVPHEKNPSKKVEAYKLSNFGKALSLFVRTQNKNFGPQLCNKMYDYWKTYFDDKSFSLDIFCKHYFLACNESGLLVGFIKVFIDYFFDMHYIFSYTELFTNMIFFRFEVDDLNDKKLWDFWKISMIKLGDKRNLFFHHLKLYIGRFIEKKVNDFSKYENARFENRSNVKFVIIEVICKNCTNKYEYLKISIMDYLKGYFLNDYRILSNYIETTSYSCKNCKNTQFEFQDFISFIT